jgi:hypothetical protein
VIELGEIDLVKLLEEINSEFAEDELAYLAATSKIEAPIQDKVAFNLHKGYGNRYLVARQWHRVDIAIVDHDDAPVCLIELTAMYTFNALKPKDLTNFMCKTKRDEQKARRQAGKNTAVYSLLVATHFIEPVKKHLKKVIKYSGRINAIFQQYQDGGAKEAVAQVNERLAGRNLVTRGKFRGGHAFGMEVGVYYWLVRDTNFPVEIPTVYPKEAIVET